MRSSMGSEPYVLEVLCAIEQAIRQENIEYLKWIFEEFKVGQFINYQLPSGTVFLFTAIEIGNVDIVKLLLEKGADPNLIRESFFSTEAPLGVAIRFNNHAIVRALLEAGANPSDVNDKNEDALACAVRVNKEKHFHEDTVIQLIVSDFSFFSQKKRYVITSDNNNATATATVCSLVN